MRRRLLVPLSLATAFATVSLVAQGQPQIASPNLTPNPAQLNQKAKVQNVPEIPYDSVPNFIKLPDNLSLGEGIGVATNSKGHVFVYTRSAATRLFEFDSPAAFVEANESLGQDSLVQKVARDLVARYMLPAQASPLNLYTTPAGTGTVPLP